MPHRRASRSSGRSIVTTPTSRSSLRSCAGAVRRARAATKPPRSSPRRPRRSPRPSAGPPPRSRRAAARARARSSPAARPRARARVPSSATGGGVDERDDERPPVEARPRAAPSRASRSPGRSMTAKPFLFLSARPEVEAVGPEYESVRRATGLDASRLDHLRLDVDPLGNLDLDDVAGVIVGGSPFNVTTPDAGKHPVQLRVEDDLARLAEAAVA